MGRGSYSGGGTVIHVGDDGTHWDGSHDPAHNKRNRARKRRNNDNQTPTAREIEIQAQQDAATERKLLRSFISQCAAAHLGAKLTATNPSPPKRLRKRINNAGGNIKWMEGNRNYQVLFHEAFCKLCNENVSFDKVWGKHA